MKNIVLPLGALVIASLGEDSLMIQESVNLGTSVVKAHNFNAHLDELNRNVYEIDKESILGKGYAQSEEIFRYNPIVGLSNVGLGSNLDLRGQGNRANTSVQVLFNGIYANMLDSSHGVSPINTLSPQSIESIEILPGGGAVMYGNGTRGGVVNIITKRRYEQPYFSAGLNYGNTLASVGNSYNADAKFGGKLFERTYISLGGAYINRGGSREGDKTSGAQANFNLTKDFGNASSVYVDVDYFSGVIDTSPNNSFQSIPNPSKSDRKTKGLGDIHNTQTRLDTSVGIDGVLSENNKLELKTFYHLNNIDYVDSSGILVNYSGASNVPYSQSGSSFKDAKIGALAKWDNTHSNGRFILGGESVYQKSERTMVMWYNATTPNIAIDHTMRIPFKGSKFSNALFAIEKYDFTPTFSVSAGARYDYSYYDVNADYHSMMNMTMTGGQTIPINTDASGSLRQSNHNFAFELTPSYAYSSSGKVYAKYERGFFAPSPNNLLRRQNSTYLPTDLEKESYDTFELGLKDYFGDVVSLSAAVFYTLTHNEFYTIGNAHNPTGVSYGNYDKTARAGFELLSEQYIFGDRLSLSESFTYIDARVLRNNGLKSSLKIPYVSNYKATLGINFKPLHFLSLYMQNSFIGAQKDMEGFVSTSPAPTAPRISVGQKHIPAYNLTDIGFHLTLGDWAFNGGVRNVFDHFYYSYYNGDSSDPIAGYGFLIGQGRSAFIEGRYTF
ncbi:MAG: TonB-dependent receptor [Helicobacter sp.]|uniref:TonB-dependent receptor n=1 Tax=Helicobacter sp. TaxID=218 RepID=UPI0025BB0330|nr:TonB-dependent receptor [Helicobacter sp.]MCH5312793.1 TonB-dependent receptor [Helicobacter sp.]